jgi:hypothetical protein
LGFAAVFFAGGSRGFLPNNPSSTFIMTASR